MYVKAKKSLGQHFLKNDAIAQQITDSMPSEYTNVLEVGPGMGVLTSKLAIQPSRNLKVVEIDGESVDYLIRNKIVTQEQVVFGDFLHLPITHYFEGSFSVIGNYPYNISSQILFKALENKDLIPCVVGMFQKEVAMRVASGPGNKDYGIISVLLQAYYDIEYLFTVNENEFIPPPKVKSGVIRLVRNKLASLPCNEKLFVSVVKTSFNQRRKTLRNSLRSITPEGIELTDVWTKRPEQLSVNQFIDLTNQIEAASIKTK